MAKKTKKVAVNKQIKPREPLLYIATGKKGVGKTFNTVNVIDDYIKGNKATGTVPRKALIIDVNNEYTKYKSLHPEDITRFTGHKIIEARRIIPYYSDGRVMSLGDLEAILKFSTENFRNGLLLIEDMTKFVGDAIPDDIVGSICTNRHKDVDIITHFQTIGKIAHPKIKPNMNILRFHKTLDSVKRHKNKLNEYYDVLKLAEMLVNSRYDDFIKANPDIQQTYFSFFVYINFDHNKIIGNFGRGEFEDIITRYVQENDKDTIVPILKRKDRIGKPLHTYSEALIKCEQDLFEKYAQAKFPF